MNSKTILILLLAIFVIKSYSKRAQCPHPTFIKKHLCTGDENTTRASECASASNRYRTKNRLLLTDRIDILFHGRVKFDLRNHDCSVVELIPRYVCTRGRRGIGWICKSALKGSALHNPYNGHSEYH